MLMTNDKAVEAVRTLATAQSKPTTRNSTSSSTAAAAQIARMVELLRRGPRNTHELRRHGISHPAGRVQDLMRRGYSITSDRVSTVDGDGFLHVNVALYAMVSGPAIPSGSKAGA